MNACSLIDQFNEFWQVTISKLLANYANILFIIKCSCLIVMFILREYIMYCCLNLYLVYNYCEIIFRFVGGSKEVDSITQLIVVDTY